jgi:hypothetical protein
MKIMIGLAVLISVVSSVARAQSQTSIQVVIDELAPTGHDGRSFVETYANVVANRLTDLDDFANFLKTQKPEICNLLCQRHVTGAYFKGDARGPGDLIRYVFTSTCYGVIPSLRRKGLALADLETVLGSQNWYRDPTKLSTYDKIVIRDVLGDALKDYLGENHLGPKPGTAPVAKANFGRVVALWKAAYRNGAPKINSLPAMWSESQDLAAFAACKDAAIEKRVPL